jgi:hypothetical protein
MVRYVFGGVSSNLLEHKISLQHPKEKEVATTFFTFFGLLNIQERGLPIEEKDIPHCPFRGIASEIDFYPEFSDLCNPDQFAKFKDGNIKLIDAGSPRVAKSILVYYESISAGRLTYQLPYAK